MTTCNAMEQLRRHLITGASITPLEALKQWGMFRLGARVHELRRNGWDVATEMIGTETGKVVARYSLPAAGSLNAQGESRRGEAGIQEGTLSPSIPPSCSGSSD